MAEDVTGRSVTVSAVEEGGVSDTEPGESVTAEVELFTDVTSDCFTSGRISLEETIKELFKLVEERQSHWLLAIG